jgi:hypothetical protein
MRARGAVLDPADMEHAAFEIDLIPTKVADLGRPQPVPEGEQDHGGVAVTVPVALGRLDQLPDLVGREVLAGPQLDVLLSLQRNCSIYFSWRDQPEMRFCHKNPSPREVNCSYLHQFTNSRQRWNQATAPWKMDFDFAHTPRTPKDDAKLAVILTGPAPTSTARTASARS